MATDLWDLSEWLVQELDDTPEDAQLPLIEHGDLQGGLSQDTDASTSTPNSMDVHAAMSDPLATSQPLAFPLESVEPTYFPQSHLQLEQQQQQQQQLQHFQQQQFEQQQLNQQQLQQQLLRRPHLNTQISHSRHQHPHLDTNIGHTNHQHPHLDTNVGHSHHPHPPNNTNIGHSHHQHTPPNYIASPTSPLDLYAGSQFHAGHDFMQMPDGSPAYQTMPSEMFMSAPSSAQQIYVPRNMPGAQISGQAFRVDPRASFQTEPDSAIDMGFDSRRTSSIAPGHEENSEDGVKRGLFLQRNREAATKCRSKKREADEALEEHRRRLHGRNVLLKAEYHARKLELNHLQNLICDHVASSGCQANDMMQWVKKHAESFPRRSIAQLLSEADRVIAGEVAEHVRQRRARGGTEQTNSEAGGGDEDEDEDEEEEEPPASA